MQGPDYTHWHGTYEVAKHFYSEFIPELQELAERGAAKPETADAAKALEEGIDRVLNAPEHRWYLGKMTDAEREERKRRSTEFQERYAD